MKVTTEDCIALLNKEVATADWKRKSKSGNATIGIKRVFEAAGLSAIVMEKDGVIYATKATVDTKVATLGTKVALDQSLGQMGFSPTKVRLVSEKKAVETENEVISDEIVNKFIKALFGKKPTTFDYKLAAAVVTLRTILPPSYATTAIIKALKGTAKAKVGQNNPAYGILAGVSLYTHDKLWKIVEGVNKFLKSGDVLETEELYVSDEDDDAGNTPPGFLTEYSESQSKVNKSHAMAVAKAITACGEKYGVQAAEPERKKTNNTKPDEVLEKLKKSGVWAKAREKANVLMEDFRRANPEDKREGWSLSSTREFHGRSYKDGILTMSFCVAAVYEKGRRSSPYNCYSLYDKETYDSIGKAPVLFSKWNDDNALVGWDVKMVDVKPRW